MLALLLFIFPEISRLIGTARGSQTKERKTASLIQERIASELAVDPAKIDALRDHYLKMVQPFTEEVWDRFIDAYADYINMVRDHHMNLDQSSRLSELFPIKDEVARELFDNIIGEWNTADVLGYINAFTWLVLGALLRDEVGGQSCPFLLSLTVRAPKSPAHSSQRPLAQTSSFL